MEGRSGGGEGGQRRGGDVLSTRLKASVNASFLRLHSRPLPCEVRKGPGFPSRVELRFG